MQFQHSAGIWRDFPALVPGVLYAEGITSTVGVSPAADRLAAIAKARLAAAGTESELPEIQAWRRAFAAMGLKPTQYRCASESLLRRFRKEGSLPALHPLVDHPGRRAQGAWALTPQTAILTAEAPRFTAGAPGQPRR